MLRTAVKIVAATAAVSTSLVGGVLVADDYVALQTDAVVCTQWMRPRSSDPTIKELRGIVEREGANLTEPLQAALELHGLLTEPPAKDVYNRVVRSVRNISHTYKLDVERKDPEALFFAVPYYAVAMKNMVDTYRRFDSEREAEALERMALQGRRLCRSYLLNKGEWSHYIRLACADASRRSHA